MNTKNMGDIFLESIDPVSVRDSFDYIRARTVDRMRDLLNSFAVYDESTEDIANLRSSVSLKFQNIIYRIRY